MRADVVLSNSLEHRTKHDLEHLSDVDDYTLRHLAVHLYEARRYEELYRLLVGNKAWMEAKSVRLGGDSAYAEDLELALNDFVDPLTVPQLLTLVQLQAARQVIRARVDIYSDIDLKALTWLGRSSEALTVARLRNEPEQRIGSLFAVYYALLKRNRPDQELLDEIWRTIPSIQEDTERVDALRQLAIALCQSDDSRSDKLFYEALETAHAIRDAAKRTSALYSLAVALAQNRHLAQAEEVAYTIENQLDRVKALGVVGIAYAQLVLLPRFYGKI